MKELLRIAASLRADPSPAVLCTLVSVSGSSFRTIGARMLWRPDGSRLGSISGGCLEADLMSQAGEVLNSGRPRIAKYDTASEADIVWGTGSGCEGTVAVWIERIVGVPPWLAFVLDAWDRRESAALLIECSIPSDNRPVGTVAARSSGGVTWKAPGNGNDFVISLALPGSLENGTSTQIQPFRDSGLLCEFLPPPPSLTIFGAGDDAQSLSRLATELGWRVTVIDSRPHLLTETRFPSTHARHLASAENAVSAAPLDERSLVVVMTHRYLDDVPLLRSLLPRPLAYLGLLGPKKRAEKILAQLARDGLTITSGMRTGLHAPVGLDLGGGTPEEVALSILAEIQATRSARDARPLRERQLPIHHDKERLEMLARKSPKFGTIILAAGASSRLGQPKQLLLHEGRPLLMRTVDAAINAGASPVVVVLGAHAEKIRPGLASSLVVIAENPAWAEGMGTSISAGLAALEAAATHDGGAAPNAVLIAVCDQPHFSAASIAGLTSALNHTPGATIAAIRHPDGAGVPAIFTDAHFPALRLLRGHEGARRIIAAHPDATAVVDLPELALDIDTPADWQRLNSR